MAGKFRYKGKIYFNNDLYDELYDEVEKNLTETELDDLLDTAYLDYKMGRMTFTPSQILKRCDPIAYKMTFDEEVDYRIEEAIYELENASNGDTIWIVGDMEVIAVGGSENRKPKTKKPVRKKPVKSRSVKKKATKPKVKKKPVKPTKKKPVSKPKKKVRK